MSTPLEHDYIRLTEASLMEASPVKSAVSSSSSSSTLCSENGKKDSSLNLKETELRLGLPGSQSPERKPALCISLFGKEFESNSSNNNRGCLGFLKSPVSGAKRGFSDAIAIDGSPVKLALSLSDGSEVDLGKGASALLSTKEGDFVNCLGGLEKNTGGTRHTCLSASVEKDAVSVPPSAKQAQEKKSQVSGGAPVAKAQVVGWPPIRSFRKNTMASNLEKRNDAAEGKSGGCLYVKVSMDGAPYLRKVDLKTCKSYVELSSALEKMFSCFTIGQYGANGIQGRDGLSQSKLMDLLHGSEYVLAYEDKDGDWMLVGDVPWEMFTKLCRRLRIMKGSEAIGLAPRAMEKCKNRT